MNLKSYLRGIGIGMIVTAIILHYSFNNQNGMSDADIKARAAQLGMIENTTLASSSNNNAGHDGNAADAIFEMLEANKNNVYDDKIQEIIISDNKADDTQVDDGEPIIDGDEEKQDGETEEGSLSEADNPETLEEPVSTVDFFSSVNNDEVQQILDKQREEKAKEEAAKEEEAKKEAEKEAEKQENINEDNASEDPESGKSHDEEPAAEDNGQAEAPDEVKYITVTVAKGDSSYSVAKKVAAAGLVSSAAKFDEFLCRNNYDKTLTVGSHKIPEGATEDEIGKILTGKSR